MYLDGDNNTLIDNCLRCFKLSSIGNQNDSCTRIWMLEIDYPDTPLIYRVKLFEFGAKARSEYATYYTLEWDVEKDSLLRVKCITKKDLAPKNGWKSLNTELSKSRIDRIYETPDLMSSGDNSSSWSMLVLQYLFKEKTYTIDFTGKSDFGKNLRGSKFAKLVRLISKEFSINVTTHTKTGFDMLSPLSTAEIDTALVR